MRRTVVVVLIAATLAMVAGATSAGAATLNTTAAQRAIADRVTATYPGITFGNVSCPSGIARKQGGKFTCTVQLPGTFIILDVTQTDDRGSVTFETRRAVVSRQALEQFVAASASLPAIVTCGTTPWLMLRTGEVYTCHAGLADTTQHDVQLEVKDTAGNVTIIGTT
jgi:hypothetical protein